MVPHVAARGHSFKGAGQYYLHDKGAETSERVAWTHTHNLPTDDAEKGMRWMAYTALNADRIKDQAGVAKCGRKATSGSVYSFSLAWAPDQQPEKKTMLDAALNTLGLLQLDDHEAVIVAHQETDHPHVHVITNLINPTTGRTAVPSYDFLTFSKWAEEFEREEGKIRCDQRVENNERRRQEAKKDREFALIKHREKEHQRKQQILELYNHSDSGKAFNAALQDAGFTLAKGDRRAYVLVEENGDTHSLSRQLKGQRAKDIRERLSDIDQEKLPIGKDISSERAHFDRDKYAAEQQEKIDQAGIDANNEKKKRKQGRGEQVKKAQSEKDPPVKAAPKPPAYDTTHLDRLDAQRTFEQRSDRLRYQQESELFSFYQTEEQEKGIQAIKDRLERRQGILWQLLGVTRQLQEEKDLLQKSLDDAKRREAEQQAKLKAEIEKVRSETSGKQLLEPKPKLSLEEKQRLIAAEKKRQIRDQMQKDQQLNKERDKDRGFEY